MVKLGSLQDVSLAYIFNIFVEEKHEFNNIIITFGDSKPYEEDHFKTHKLASEKRTASKEDEMSDL